MIPLRAFKIRFPQPPIKHTHKQRAVFGLNTHNTRRRTFNATLFSLHALRFWWWPGRKMDRIADRRGCARHRAYAIVNLFRQIYAVFCFLAAFCSPPLFIRPFGAAAEKCVRSHCERAHAVYYFK
jgi:hypothetical protein